jgi:hypothetical protein
MHIQSSHHGIKKALEAIAALIRDNGGYIHPNLQVRHAGHALSLHCSASLDECLLDIPHTLFIPVTGLEWFEAQGSLAYRGDTAQLSAVQQKLLDQMLYVFNATEKMAFARQHLPMTGLRQDADILNWLLRVQPEFRLSEMDNARQFIQTRLYESQADGNGTGYLMPLIDMINHHPEASNYIRTTDDHWRILLHHGNSGTDQCFVRYSRADSLSLALWYGYAEVHTRHVAALDCRLPLHGIGTVHIKAGLTSRMKINAPRICQTDMEFVIQDIVLEKTGIANLKTFLGLAIRSRLRQLGQSEAERYAQALIARIIDASRVEYQNLADICTASPQCSIQRHLFAEVAGHQLRLLDDMAAVLAQHE